MSPQYGELRPTTSWDRFGSLGHPSKFQQVLRIPTKLCTRFGRLLGWYTIYTFLGALAPTFTLRPSLAFSYSRSVTAWHSSSGCQPNFVSLWHGTRNWIMELLQRAPPIFGWAAITLGIGPHCSFLFFLQCIVLGTAHSFISMPCFFTFSDKLYCCFSHPVYPLCFLLIYTSARYVGQTCCK